MICRSMSFKQTWSIFEEISTYVFMFDVISSGLPLVDMPDTIFTFVSCPQYQPQGWACGFVQLNGQIKWQILLLLLLSLFFIYFFCPCFMYFPPCFLQRNETHISSSFYQSASFPPSLHLLLDVGSNLTWFPNGIIQNISLRRHAQSIINFH